MSRFDSRRYQTFWEVIGLERGPLILVSIIEKLLGRKSSGSGLETENKAVGIRRADHEASSIGKSWDKCRRQAAVFSVGIVRSRTQAMEFSFSF
jgi:hypothetical protein